MKMLSAWTLLFAAISLPCTAEGSGAAIPLHNQMCLYQLKDDIYIELTFSHRNSLYEPKVKTTIKNLSKKEDLHIVNELTEHAPWVVLIYSLGSNAIDVTKRNRTPIEPGRMVNREEPLKMHRRGLKSILITPLSAHDSEIDLRDFIDEKKLSALPADTKLNVSVDMAGPVWRNFDAIEENRARSGALSKASNVAGCSALSGVSINWKR